MSSANKRRGTTFERAIEGYLLEEGLSATRLPRAGSRDIGDLHVQIKGQPGPEYLVIEAKARKALNLSEWLKEAEIEAAHHEARYGRPTHPIVIHKARGRGTAEARVTMTLADFIGLLRAQGVVGV